MGVPFDEVTRAFSRQGIKGRAEIVPTGRGFTVVIDYAHTPDGLEKICKTLRNAAAAGWLPCSAAAGRPRERPLMGRIAAEISDFVIVTSDNPRTENPGAIIEDILKGIPEKTAYKVIENRVEERYAGRLKTRSPATQSCLPARGMKPTRFGRPHNPSGRAGIWRTRSINCENRIEHAGVFIRRPRI